MYGRPGCDNRKRNDGGSILILCLWTLFFLSALAIAMAGHVDSGLRFASWFKTTTTATCLARAAAEKACIDLTADTNAWDGADESWYGNDQLYRGVAMEGGSYSVLSVLEKSDRSWTTNSGLSDEESRININNAGVELMTGLLRVAGGMDALSAKEVAMSVVDWRDAGTESLSGGAENVHAGGLPGLTMAHNADYQSVHELLLVRGISRELFDRIEPYVTIYGSGRVNINTAGPTVLAATSLAGGGDMATSASLAAKISGLRDSGKALQGGTVVDTVRQFGRLAGLSAGEESLFSRMIQFATLQSTCFRGMAEGVAESTVDSSGKAPPAAKMRITFVAERKSGRKLYWHEE